MVSLDNAVIARLKHEEHEFQVWVDPNLALAFRHGKQVSFRDLLAYEAVYKDAKKGDVAPENLLKKVFGTTDANEITAEILKKGEVQLTTEQKRAFSDEA